MVVPISPQILKRQNNVLADLQGFIGLGTGVMDFLSNNNLRNIQGEMYKEQERGLKLANDRSEAIWNAYTKPIAEEENIPKPNSPLDLIVQKVANDYLNNPDIYNSGKNLSNQKEQQPIQTQEQPPSNLSNENIQQPTQTQSVGDITKQAKVLPGQQVSLPQQSQPQIKQGKLIKQGGVQTMQPSEPVDNLTQGNIHTPSPDFTPEQKQAIELMQVQQVMNTDVSQPTDNSIFAGRQAFVDSSKVGMLIAQQSITTGTVDPVMWQLYNMNQNQRQEWLDQQLIDKGIYDTPPIGMIDAYESQIGALTMRNSFPPGSSEYNMYDAEYKKYSDIINPYYQGLSNVGRASFTKAVQVHQSLRVPAQESAKMVSLSIDAGKARAAQAELAAKQIVSTEKIAAADNQNKLEVTQLSGDIQYKLNGQTLDAHAVEYRLGLDQNMNQFRQSLEFQYLTTANQQNIEKANIQANLDMHYADVMQKYREGLTNKEYTNMIGLSQIHTTIGSLQSQLATAQTQQAYAKDPITKNSYNSTINSLTAQINALNKYSDSIINAGTTTNPLTGIVDNPLVKNYNQYLSDSLGSSEFIHQSDSQQEAIMSGTYSQLKITPTVRNIQDFNSYIGIAQLRDDKGKLIPKMDSQTFYNDFKSKFNEYAMQNGRIDLVNYNYTQTETDNAYRVYSFAYDNIKIAMFKPFGYGATGNEKVSSVSKPAILKQPQQNITKPIQSMSITLQKGTDFKVNLNNFNIEEISPKYDYMKEDIHKTYILNAIKDPIKEIPVPIYNNIKNNIITNIPSEYYESVLPSKQIEYKDQLSEQIIGMGERWIKARQQKGLPIIKSEFNSNDLNKQNLQQDNYPIINQKWFYGYTPDQLMQLLQPYIDSVVPETNITIK